MGTKFDFTVADQLVSAVEQTASALEVKNGQIEKHFGALHEGFKDSAYDEYAMDMSKANKAIQDVVTQLRQVGKHIAQYAEKLRGIAP